MGGGAIFGQSFQPGKAKEKGFGNPPDGDPPPDLNWDMWLGPAPRVPFNPNRWGVKTTTFPTFRYFWDYAGGAMTDWGVPLRDPLHAALHESRPRSTARRGSNCSIKRTR